LKRVQDADAKAKNTAEQLKLYTEQLTNEVKTVQSRQVNLTEKFVEYNQTIEEFAKLNAERLH